MIFTRKKTSSGELKGQTGEHLRTADKLVRMKRYNEALQEIENAFKIDPDNVYTRSFLERTRFLIHKENEKRSQVFGETTITSEERMETVSRLFAVVEDFIKDKKYPEALNELANVYRIDPKNYYAQAYSDRIRTLMQTAPKNNDIKESESPPPAPPKIESSFSSTPIPPVYDGERSHTGSTASSPRAQINEQEIDVLLSSKSTIASYNEIRTQPAKSPFVLSKSKRGFELGDLPGAGPVTPVQDKAPEQPKYQPLSKFTQTNEQQEEVRRCSLYRELLRECWVDGVVTPEESDMLHQARMQYAISFDMHCQIEIGIKIDAYVDALRIVWRDGVVNNNEQEVLEIMRKKFGITREEQAAAEEKFSALRSSKQVNATILIVDNDYHNLIYVARALINHGYDVKIERLPGEALHYLNTNSPDLILSETVFPQSDTDGFEFFQRTRSNPRLNQIPFLMMTNVDDPRIMRAGLRMGVDYFIPKPLHIGNMVSIIEGKLKSGPKGAPQR